MTVIKINNAKFYAYHGDLEYERQYGNQFEVDIEMNCDLTLLDNLDKLTKTVDYLAVYNTVRDIFNKNKFYLIETVNKKICDVLLERFPLIQEIKVSVRKPNAPLGIIDSVEVVNQIKR
ncbi:MAG TPA: dihydroneopterin aldolase [Ignavibacteria bacterium]|nr:dihydroneopterin aldolase [Ignavibacteria bacterium]